MKAFISISCHSICRGEGTGNIGAGAELGAGARAGAEGELGADLELGAAFWAKVDRLGVRPRQNKVYISLRENISGRLI